MTYYPPRRQQRATQLIAHIMHVIEKHLPYDDRNNCRRNIARELEELFYASGVDVITEADRVQAGLQPRDHNGLTLDEIRAINARFLKAMLEPLPFVVKPEE